jgi:hypothetical protein
MSRYIPKVGEAFQWKDGFHTIWSTESKAVFTTDNEIAFIQMGLIRTLLNKECEFRPAPTKSDVERKQLIEIIEECYDSGCSIITKEIQQAGFTIPKKIKRKDIAAIINKAHPMDITITIDFLCELLGDLVEQGDKGGKE